MRLIDADRLKEAISADFQTLQTIDEHTAFIFRNDIDECPTIDPERRGTWIDDPYTGEEIGSDYRICSYCESPFESYEKPRYCPNCGARMAEKGERG